jgi:hypothetical protein
MRVRSVCTCARVCACACACVKIESWCRTSTPWECVTAPRVASNNLRVYVYYTHVGTFFLQCVCTRMRRINVCGNDINNDININISNVCIVCVAGELSTMATIEGQSFWRYMRKYDVCVVLCMCVCTWQTTEGVAKKTIPLYNYGVYCVGVRVCVCLRVCVRVCVY